MEKGVKIFGVSSNDGAFGVIRCSLPAKAVNIFFFLSKIWHGGFYADRVIPGITG